MWITFPSAKRFSVTGLADPEVPAMSVHQLEVPTRVIEHPVTRRNLDDPQGCRTVRQPQAATSPIPRYTYPQLRRITLTKCSKIPHSLMHLPKCFPRHVDHI